MQKQLTEAGELELEFKVLSVDWPRLGFKSQIAASHQCRRSTKVAAPAHCIQMLAGIGHAESKVQKIMFSQGAKRNPPKRGSKPGEQI